ncbi:Peptidase_S8 domain-containing protein/Inhibitor_I9 domain-containing protein [Cephalotus follicularis]|uniref:Peptidase_S8 domain-containing protein/Inhibitor_I9 domain-containing protein n=1 Tax=Cephalotus follicularis TaxID=3775 RepID=A0A1Q3ANP9_CEPFO|nr:Peptidase_S8 domain-containing protein/Inhibitor_I9 domain-containing protein [Cephalotus follicularis]
MGSFYLVRSVLVLWLGFLFVGTLCESQDDSDSITAVYIVTLKQAPASHFNGELRREAHGFKLGAAERLNRFNKPRNVSMSHENPDSYIARLHDSLLRRVLRGEKYLKLYSYRYLINGFAVFVTTRQAEKLSRSGEVANVVLDFSVRTATTHTPQFLGLPKGAWVQMGGYETAGKGIVIGFVDTGIDPTHPSFSDDVSEQSYPVPAHYSGICEVTRDFPSGSCNRKLIGARHFAASAITRGIFNSSQDYASPFDGDGHGTHTASVAAGNHGIPLVVAGHHFGNASGMAPHSHIAVYKALYKSFGGFAADVVAAIDQAAQDGVDIISLSITPNRRPPGIATFFNPIDMALLSAVKAGIFVVQAAGNTGPSPKSMSSFSPWIFTVGAASHDRVYANSIILGNNVTISGVGLAPGTDDQNTMYMLISAIHALNNDTTFANDMYVGECQDSSSFNKDIVQGNLLICSYSIRFVLGLSTIKQALQTAKNLSAVGVVFYMDPFVIGFQLNPTPMKIPGIIIPSPEDSKILLQYYNSSLERDGVTKKIVRFGAVACISGGIKANYSILAPKIMYYSARGPDPEDSFLDDADIMKPNLVAPGNSIWAAWSSLGTDSVEFQGENFAMMSGTSMAAPHVAGLAALIKQRFPSFSPSAIGSALSTTASQYAKNGGPIMAQRAYANPDLNQSPATPFDMGSGFVNATGALDPGLIFDSNYDDYMSFLCGINGSAPVVLNFTGQNCWNYNNSLSGTDLNLPSIAIAKLNKSRTIQRSVMNIGINETYSVGWSAPYGVTLKVAPSRFSIATGEQQVLTVFVNATTNSTAASFGRIGLFGDQGHVVNIPLSVIVKVSYNISNS